MATSSFKSTTKRSPIGGTVSNVDDAAASSNHNATHHRRSRSLSTFSGRSHALESDELPAATPRRRFVNTVRGSGFPEVISLDDIANDFFPLNLKDRDLDLDLNPDTDVLRESERGRSRSSSARRTSAIGATCSSATTSGSKGVSHSQEQRRGRSVSRQHGRLGDPAANASASTVKALADSCSNSRRRRSLSVARCQFSDSEIEHPTADGEGTALYEAMRKELRHAVEEIRTELEQTMVKTRPTVLVDGDCLQSSNSDVLQAVAIIRKNYTSKLEQSEKRKQDLLAEIVVEEQRGRELSKIVRELLPDPEKAACIEKPSCARKGSNDRSRMSKCLTEEAEKYFEDFISNVEDTDISSFDGERSDASSTLGGTRPRDYMIHCGETETYGISTGSSLPVEMDGVLLPWLRWEASNDHSPPLCKSREEATTGKSNIHDAPLEVSSRGFRVPGSYLGHSANYGPSGSWFDRDEYPHFADNEDVLFECWRQRRRINSGGLILCSSTFL
ncbi:uncharacterized protein LOC122073662 isoform X3 [Macadamia integrifolia]|uniref:uncharacterized protein LOC122073662 isoform X3 n=1 Tax=Macadamia integrifolia TaxID=60698 RepID=UPI001C4E7F2B|nr:uncharacterized protein LOC122073662 isoform X3 [Macadamia integrifolia]